MRSTFTHPQRKNGNCDTKRHHINTHTSKKIIKIKYTKRKTEIIYKPTSTTTANIHKKLIYNLANRDLSYNSVTADAIIFAPNTTSFSVVYRPILSLSVPIP